MTKEISHEEYECFHEVWKLYKEIGTAEENDAYWKDAVRKVEAYRNRFDTRLGHGLSNAILEVLLDIPESQRLKRWISILMIYAMKDKEVRDFFMITAIKLMEYERSDKK